MKYLGSKAKIADEILPIILANRKPWQLYVEPFVGGANTLIRVTGNRLASDKNPFLIALLIALRDGWEPPAVVTEGEYKAAMVKSKSYDRLRWTPEQLNTEIARIGYIGLACSFGAKFFGGIARKAKRTTRRETDVIEFDSRQAFMDHAPALQGVEFRCGSFMSLEVPGSSIVYCDPPYEATTGYNYSIGNFSEFWAWCDGLVERGCEVFVSGYHLERRWRAVWQRVVTTNVAIADGLKKLATERTELLMQREDQWQAGFAG
jgi:DNA adenine methylase